MVRHTFTDMSLTIKYFEIIISLLEKKLEQLILTFVSGAYNFETHDLMIIRHAANEENYK